MIRIPLQSYKKTLFRPSLLTINDLFIRPHLDYGDRIYDQVYIVSFQQKLESIHYNAALTIAGAIRGTSEKKLFEELFLAFLQRKRW